MARNAHIRPEHGEKICQLIHQWIGPQINWFEVCIACAPILGYVPSRSGLSSHGDVQLAFRSRKQELRALPPDRQPLPNSRAAAARSIETKDSEIATLKLQVRELMGQFIRWQYNAALHGVTSEMLDDPSKQVVIDRIKVAGKGVKSRP